MVTILRKLEDWSYVIADWFYDLFEYFRDRADAMEGYSVIKVLLNKDDDEEE